MAQEGGYDPLIAELIKPCPSCASIRDKNERQAEVVRSFGNSLEKAMKENAALHSSLAAKDEELKRLLEMLEQVYTEYIYPDEVWREWDWAQEYRELRRRAKEG